MKTFTKFGLAAVSATLLALGAASPAFAADINVGPSDVAGYEQGTATADDFNYTQWHVGNYTVSTPVSTSLSFNECGVTLLAAPSAGSFTQVLLGFENRPTTATTMTTADLETLFSSISIDVAQGDVTLQVPMFAYETAESTSPGFTTARNQSVFGPGVHTFTGVPLTFSGSAFTSGATSAELLETMQTRADGVGAAYFEILGVGFNGSADAVVNSISFGGNTYYFGTGNCAPAAPTVPTSVQTAAQ